MTILEEAAKMSGLTLKTFFDERRGKWRLLWGDETFYDSEDRLIEFDTEQELLDWWAGYPKIVDLEVTTSQDE